MGNFTRCRPNVEIRNRFAYLVLWTGRSRAHSSGRKRILNKQISNLALCLLAAAAAGCSTSVPRNINDGCEIFDEKPGWYKAARKSEQRWKTPISVQLAIVHQESKFRARAKPPRRKLLGFIPWQRPSTAFGYSQALKSTWREYKRATGNRGADRHKFHDAIDFVGWYTNRSVKTLGLKPHDTKNLYLAYHEGDGGFKRKTYTRKAWLVRVADRVAKNAGRYERQLAGCRERLDKGRGWFGLF